MPNYRYKAINSAGNVIKGTLMAANVLELEYKIKGLDLEVISYAKTTEFSLFSTKVTTTDIIALCLQLEQLSHAGVPILEAIADLRDNAGQDKLRAILSDIYENLKKGRTLSEAFAQQPRIFDQVFVGLVGAGEKTGNMEEIFHHLAKHLYWVEKMRKNIQKAIRYPLFVLCLMMGVVGLMMLFVMPKLTDFLLNQGFAIPLYTKVLIGFSRILQHYWSLFIVLPILSIAAIHLLRRRSESFSYHYDGFLLNIPVLGVIARKMEMARFSRFFSITYRSGIPIMDCLDIARHVSNNQVIRLAINHAKRQVSEGSSLTNALKQTGHFPALVIRMIRVGEESGNLDRTLDGVNLFYDHEVEESVNQIIGMIQPAMTFVLGGLLFWIIASIFGPLYGNLKYVG